MHSNQMTTLRSCERFLPTALVTLTVNDNHLQDLTEISQLVHLSCLEQLTLVNNPAVRQPDDLPSQFDYRPFVINWCLSLRLLDGVSVGAKERYDRTT